MAFENAHNNYLQMFKIITVDDSSFTYLLFWLSRLIIWKCQFILYRHFTDDDLLLKSSIIFSYLNICNYSTAFDTFPGLLRYVLIQNPESLDMIGLILRKKCKLYKFIISIDTFVHIVSMPKAMLSYVQLIYIQGVKV